MNLEFWQSRWYEGRIGFHKSAVNPLLTQYFSELDLPIGSQIFVPLCGKSVDMVWLAAQGYDVVGVELSEIAVEAFFAEQNITPTIHQYSDNPAIKYYQGQFTSQTTEQTITLWIADIFAVTSKDIGHVDAVYDRAALIALPATIRSAYAEQILRICGKSNDNNKKAPQLLITLDYDQTKKDGPPFSVTNTQVEQYYGNHYQIIALKSNISTLNSAKELAVTEDVWLLKDL